MFVEFHLLQSFVPSNLNRDDNGYPKSGVFGGARRARISSQCIKRAIRTSDVFKSEIPTGDGGTRTRRMMELFQPRLNKAGKKEAEIEVVVKAFTTAYAGLDDKNKDLSSVLVYLSREDIDAMTNAMLENWQAILESVPEKDGKRQYSKDAFKKEKHPIHVAIKALEAQTAQRSSAPDIALFGRMLADNPKFALDAACVVANATSTHAVQEMEVDYFTAMDDELPKGEQGAGQINLTGFNSACYYRYASIDREQLKLNLRGQGLTDADKDVLRGTVSGFMRGLTEVVPSGMKNRFGQHNPPDFALAVVRTSGPGWSLANAFESPVNVETGLMPRSVSKLDKYWNDLTRAYGSQSVKRAVFCLVNSDLEAQVKHLSDKVSSFEEWRATVLAALDEGDANA
ncbi:MAG: type I-E CRISPR-associated protein Cas7/Cse4/CasC [Chloroflexi bacterium]|nr:type I-E CRISPR-associated protein Cas7/Cse4/CasC [Chloroflexota bacterium]